jgi:hypothetical protein
MLANLLRRNRRAYGPRINVADRLCQLRQTLRLRAIARVPDDLIGDRPLAFVYDQDHAVNVCAAFQVRARWCLNYSTDCVICSQPLSKLAAGAAEIGRRHQRNHAPAIR